MSDSGFDATKLEGIALDIYNLALKAAEATLQDHLDEVDEAQRSYKARLRAVEDRIFASEETA